MSIVRIAGIVTLLAVTGFVALMLGRDRRARRTLHETTSSPDGLPQLRIPTSNDSHGQIPSFSAAGFDDAHEVDALYFALIAVSLFFIAIIFLPIIFFSVKYRRGSKADRSNPSSGSQLLEGGWTMGAIVLGLGLFSLGCDRLTSGWSAVRRTQSTCRWSANNGCGSCSTPKANARSTSCTCRSIDSGSDYDIAGRDPQFFRPSVSRQTGRRARAVHQRVVQGDQAG